MQIVPADSAARDLSKPVLDTSKAPDRAPRRPRATRALPTDRMRFEKQVEVLRAFSVASRDGALPVDANMLSSFSNVAAVTVVLDNNFFLESGLITRVKKGQYIPVAEVNEFRRLFTFNDPQASRVLAPVLEKTWYFEALRIFDEMGSPSRAQAVRLLADHAGADGSFTAQIELLLDWLCFVGLVEINEDEKVLVNGVEGRWIDAEVDPAKAKRDEANAVTPRPGTSGTITTIQEPVINARPSPTVLAWSFEVKLTADDLSKLSPEQIKAVFEAAGTVAAVRPLS
jgi:hypothetical protein